MCIRDRERACKINSCVRKLRQRGLQRSLKQSSFKSLAHSATVDDESDKTPSTNDPEFRANFCQSSSYSIVADSAVCISDYQDCEMVLLVQEYGVFRRIWKVRILKSSTTPP